MSNVLPLTWEEILRDPQVLGGSITGWTVCQGKLRGPLTEVRNYRGVITITSAWTASFQENTRPEFQKWYRRGGTTWEINENASRPWICVREGGYIGFLLPPYSMCYFTLRDYGGAEHLDLSKLHELPTVAA